MSQVYSTEPATTGHVVFETSHGPIDVHLFCKECPTTTRAFLQLCLDGYYDGLVFHRILSDFLIQTGLTKNSALTATASADEMDKYLRSSTAVSSKSSGMSGDALGWDRKKLEVNPRIRFNHRGQVAIALPLEESSVTDSTNNENGEETALLRYQFFITLDEAPFLDAKHVIFGTVAGSTMFNALRIGRTDADEQTGIPADLDDCPPTIKSVKIDYHPFEDLVVTAEKKIPWKNSIAAADNDSGGASRKGNSGQRSTMEKRRKKRKGKRDFNVLSFGDEERDYDLSITSSTTNNSASMKSSHDMLAGESKFLSAKVDAEVETRSKLKDDEKYVGTSKLKANNSSIQKVEDTINEQSEVNDGQAPTHDTVALEEQNGQHEQPIASKQEDRPVKRSKSYKSKGISGVEARRSKYLKSGAGSISSKKDRLRREDNTMAKLLAFKTKVLETKGSSNNIKGETKRTATNDDSLAARMAKRMKQSEEEEEMRNEEKEAFISMPGYNGQVTDDQADTTGGDWMSTKFKCKQHADNDSRALDRIGNSQEDDMLGGDGRKMDDYFVFDEKHRNRGGSKNGLHSRHKHR
ncbi:hypothetical protein ACHAWC_004155 [Mediolabrus comicus]